ncbi:MAG: hypothetical protein INR62_04535 [Rhodospirillales bacterium]|nr:hypothetical protein [Acetobacter sp.]
MKRFLTILVFAGLLYFVAACALPALWRLPGLDTFYLGLFGYSAPVGSFSCWLLYPAFSLLVLYYTPGESGFYPHTWELCLLASGIVYGLAAASVISAVQHFRHPRAAT